MKRSFRRGTTMRFLSSILILRTVTEALQVIGGNITKAQGETAVLPCKLINTTETLTQISWQRKTRKKPQNENFFTILSKNGPIFVGEPDDRFKFLGSISDSEGPLQLSNVTLMDEGNYTCIFTLFPSGNYKTVIPLNVLVPPVSSLQNNRPTLGTEEVSLVTCTAAGSKPPAEVRWLTGTLEGKVRPTTNSTEHDNGTTTTVSSLFGVPTTEINHHLVRCVITYAAQSKEEDLPFNLQVYFSPMDVRILERSKSLFECVTEANPSANFAWNRSDGSLPHSAVKVENAILQFLSMTSDLNGLYQCEASNPHGKKRGYLYVQVTKEVDVVGWIFFGLLLSLNVAAAVWYLYKSGRFGRTREGVARTRPGETTSYSLPSNAQAVGGKQEEVEEEGEEEEEVNGL